MYVKDESSAFQVDRPRPVAPPLLLIHPFLDQSVVSDVNHVDIGLIFSIIHHFESIYML